MHVAIYRIYNAKGEQTGECSGDLDNMKDVRRDLDHLIRHKEPGDVRIVADIALGPTSLPEDLAPAQGCLFGLLISMIMWAVAVGAAFAWACYRASS